MEAFLVSTGIVALAEMGDKTQLLSLVLAARFRRPWPIVLGILAATRSNTLVADLPIAGHFVTYPWLGDVVAWGCLGVLILGACGALRRRDRAGSKGVIGGDQTDISIKRAS